MKNHTFKFKIVQKIRTCFLLYESSFLEVHTKKIGWVFKSWESQNISDGY
jgi:hypothetical protein